MINVATGVLHFSIEDIILPGKVNLVWGRYYSTALLKSKRLKSNPLGLGWRNPYFATLTLNKKQYVFVNGEGQVGLFNDKDNRLITGEMLQELRSFWGLSIDYPHYVVTNWPSKDKDHLLRYVFKADSEKKTFLLIGIEDATGQGLDLLYDRQGSLIQIRQRLEQRTLTLHYTYDTQYRISKVTLTRFQKPEMLLAHYDYDPKGRLKTAYDAKNQAEHYRYDDRST